MCLRLPRMQKKSENKMEPTDLSVKSKKIYQASPRDVTNLETKDRRPSAFVPVAPSSSTIVPPALPYQFLAGLPSTTAAAAGHMLTGTLTVYSDILQHQLTGRPDLNSSMSSHGDETEAAPSSGHKKHTKARRHAKQNKSASKVGHLFKKCKQAAVIFPNNVNNQLIFFQKM